ncbi:MAG: hypothetical protein HON90_10065 [Halobacteriovoraceae bacterium]|nr:hypothetical protein [Halobacteriovoraceae bacterium]
MQDHSIILNRLRKNLKKRKSLIKNSNLNAYRLYEKDIPEYPYIIDIFNQYAVVYEKGKKFDDDEVEELTQTRQRHQKHIISALKEACDIPTSHIVFKTRQKQKGKDQYQKIMRSEEFFIIKELGMKFRVNVHDYLDPGLFLDHRPLRKTIKETSKNKKILNLFAYTGSLSVAAALGGGLVTTIDMSKTYLNWAWENFLLNEIDPEKHEFIQADVINLVTNELNTKYDIIILDPPSFSNSKRMEDNFDVQRDHGNLIKPLMKNLTSNGILYFSNNYRKFKLDTEILDNYAVKDITLKSIPADFRDLKIHTCFEITNKFTS